MLVAKRDPFHSGANDVSISRGAGAAPRFARAISALQIAGTLLAVPVGLGSAYSMYRANFSVEATCQSLRANIVAMLDRSVDTNARHMLVRRDVETFERTCGKVDPDATAAFKTLLAADKKSPPIVAPVAIAAPPRTEAKPEAVARKAESRLDATIKQPGTSTPSVAVEAKPVQRDTTTTDAIWMAAVRQALMKDALVTHGHDPAQASVAAPTTVATAPPAAAQAAQAGQVVAPMSLDKRTLGELRTAPVSLAAPAPISAPALPPPASVASAPAPQADDGHPVPPGAIPDVVPANTGTAEDHSNRSRLGALIAQIPFVGRAFER